MRYIVAIFFVVSWITPSLGTGNTEGFVKTLCTLTSEPTTTAMKELGTVEHSKLPSGTSTWKAEGKTFKGQYMFWLDPNDHSLTVSRTDKRAFFSDKDAARKWIEKFGRFQPTSLSAAMVVEDTGDPATDRAHGWEFTINLPMDAVGLQWADQTAYRNRVFCK